MGGVGFQLFSVLLHRLWIITLDCSPWLAELTFIHIFGISAIRFFDSNKSNFLYLKFHFLISVIRGHLISINRRELWISINRFFWIFTVYSYVTFVIGILIVAVAVTYLILAVYLQSPWTNFQQAGLLCKCVKSVKNTTV